MSGPGETDRSGLSDAKHKKDVFTRRRRVYPSHEGERERHRATVREAAR